MRSPFRTVSIRLVCAQCWWKDKYDGDHPLTMITEPAVMADKIAVTGQEWVEPTSETTCNLWFQLTVKVFASLCCEWKV